MDVTRRIECKKCLNLHKAKCWLDHSRADQALRPRYRSKLIPDLRMHHPRGNALTWHSGKSRRIDSAIIQKQLN
ncbi:hypothetical protein KIN20_011594 [Parelaphostrongylus tenuis]|uniref:Uncharacterized protein n=1 Tax=Parelaphostrongylus tenuis TaxID=148309 RepID=A0AAD5MVL1_PARTN|nr:hypothetical protein KIN20_011594 [Parelaphostrongylus tenuis]